MKAFLIGFLFTIAVVGGPFLVMYVLGFLYTKKFDPKYIKDKDFVFYRGVIICAIIALIICAVNIMHIVGVEILKE